MKYTVEEFAREIRKLYPGDYNDLSDGTLIELWLKKYPQDEEKLIHGSPYKSDEERTPILPKARTQVYRSSEERAPMKVKKGNSILLILFFIVLASVGGYFLIINNSSREYLASDRISQTPTKTSIPNAVKVIHILPLGAVHTEYIEEITSAIKKFYGYDCIVLPPAKPTQDIMAASNMRYEANKVLKKYNSNDYLLILTEEDIAYPNEKRKEKEWGVFGLGNMPGTTCVVSTFRLRRTNGNLVPHELFMERLDKIVLHEIGHNLGLNHCTNDPVCMMCNTYGTIEEVDQERVWFCDRCKKQLH